MTTTQTQPDGTVVNYDDAGNPVRETTPDGTVYDRFDGQGRPLHGTAPAPDAAHATTMNITYATDGTGTTVYSDGTQTISDPHGTLIREVTPDGATYTRFDGQGRPLEGTVQGQSVTIDYTAAGSHETYGDGSQVWRDGSGTLTRQITSDGVTFSSFHGDQPGMASIPAQGGQPATTATISYQGDQSTWTYADGSRVVRNAGGQPVEQVTPTGDTFTSFDGQGRPTAGTVNGQHVDVTYTADGSVWTTADGTRTVENTGGTVVEEITPDGADFTLFDAQGRPTGGTVNGSRVDIAYTASGSTWTYADGTKVTRDTSGQTVEEVTPDGAEFTTFDAQGRPTAGTVNGSHVDIGYTATGSTWTYADGTTLNRDAGGRTVSETTPDGWTFTSFDAQGQPTAGSKDGQSVTVAYSPVGSTWTYSDGTKVVKNGDGATTSEATSDGWTFTSFDGQGRPTAGVNNGQSVTVTYATDGSAAWTYADGSTLYRDPNGNLVKETTPDGWTFTAFDDQGRPTAGSKDGQNVTFTYGPGGEVTTHFPDGTSITTDKNNRPISEVLADGTTVQFAVAIPALHEAIGKIRTYKTNLDGDLKTVKNFLHAIEMSWTSPAGTAYAGLTTDVNKLSDDLQGVFQDAIDRMQHSYDNYVEAEGGNLNNLTVSN